MHPHRLIFSTTINVLCAPSWTENVNGVAYQVLVFYVSANAVVTSSITQIITVTGSLAVMYLFNLYAPASGAVGNSRAVAGSTLLIAVNS